MHGLFFKLPLLDTIPPAVEITRSDVNLNAISLSVMSLANNVSRTRRIYELEDIIYNVDKQLFAFSSSQPKMDLYL